MVCDCLLPQPAAGRDTVHDFLEQLDPKELELLRESLVRKLMERKVLEAKLVFANGFSISLASEWLENQNGKFNKQDCDRSDDSRDGI